MASGDDLPALVERIVGPDYEGPLSDFDEWHSLEMGVFVGLVYALTGSRELAGGFVAIALGKRAATGEIRTQVAREPHYFGVGFVAGYLLGAGPRLLGV